MATRNRAGHGRAGAWGYTLLKITVLCSSDCEKREPARNRRPRAWQGLVGHPPPTLRCLAAGASEAKFWHPSTILHMFMEH